MRSVLLIDDDNVVRTVLAQALTRAGWQVIEAEDGREGIQKTLEHKPAAVICDLLMPRCNGFQVCRTLREHASELPDLKIIVTTSRAFDTDRFNALESGADTVLTKPVDIPKLLASLEHARGSKQMNAGRTNSSSPEETADGETAGTEGDFLRFWGVRGSIPTPGPATVHYGGNTSCVEVRLNGRLIIFDAGSGLRALGDHLMGEVPKQTHDMTLLLTHTHWDHIQGFPFFVPAYVSGNRLRVIGYEGSRQGLEKTFCVQMESPFFPIGLKQMQGNICFDEQSELSFDIGEIKCRARFTNHPGITAGYRLETPAGTIVYIPDHESYTRMRLHTNNAPSDADNVAGYAQGEEEELEAFVRNADVLMMDSQYTAEEYPTKVGWGHSCFEDTVALAAKAGVRRLYLFHHDPRRTDEDLSRIVGQAREQAAGLGSQLIVEAAREGSRIDFP
jgi:phosphoribosyl 1,2-cyclic phosphodiesterase/CheY-like chemotaxis protein